ncbi:MAG: hypothetical protein V7K68_15695 [Nostoc sp.]|uniref:hypothetical protein n=1 Tax=Nostoc sp. TaxID=1180 RepID=UPI002FFAF607
MLSYQLEGCIARDRQVGTLSPPRRSRAVSLHPVIELSRKAEGSSCWRNTVSCSLSPPKGS